MGAQQIKEPPPVNIPKPTLADVPQPIQGAQNFDASKYAPNLQAAMQNVYNLQQRAVQQRQSQIAQVQAQNQAKMDAYNQQVAQAEAARQQQIIMQRQMLAQNNQKTTTAKYPKR